jgi:hypothetical protein
MREMKKKKAMPVRKKTGRAEGSRKEPNLKTDPDELRGSPTLPWVRKLPTLLLVKV